MTTRNYDAPPAMDAYLRLSAAARARVRRILERLGATRALARIDAFERAEATGEPAPPEVLCDDRRVRVEVYPDRVVAVEDGVGRVAIAIRDGGGS